MATAIKCRTEGVVIVDRESFLASLAGGFALLASQVICYRPVEDNLFRGFFTVKSGGEKATGWINHAQYAGAPDWVEVEVYFQMEGDEGESAVTVDIDLNFHDDEESVKAYETTWEDDEPYDLDIVQLKALAKVEADNPNSPHYVGSDGLGRE